MDELIECQFIATKSRFIEPRCPEGVGLTWAGQGIVLEQHLPTVFFLHWPLACLCFCPHIQAFPCIPGSKGKDKDPVGAVQKVLGGRCQTPGAALDATLLCGLQWEMTQPDEAAKHGVLCFIGEGAQWPSSLEGMRGVLSRGNGCG